MRGLTGFRIEAQARLVERSLSRFEAVSLIDPELVAKAAANYRFMRRRGITVRTTTDVIIATHCIERDHSLLHSDRDFALMERLLGLQIA